MAVSDDSTGETGGRWVPSNHVFWGATAVALAHLAFVVVRPSPTTIELAVFELVVLTGLGTMEVFNRTDRYLRGLAVVVGSFLAVVGGTWLLLDELAVLWVTVVLAVVVSLWSYGLHRYQLVTLGLVEGTDEQ
jgi:hypothetical protein